MAEGEGAVAAALRNWLEPRLAGNIEPWALKAEAEETLTFAAQADLTYRWRDMRTRGERNEEATPLDAQIDAALRAKPLDRAALDATRAAPREWLRQGLTDKPLPGFRFQQTRLEQCDTCTGSGKVRCSPCGGTGKVDCRTCGGTGLLRRNCNACSGGSNLVAEEIRWQENGVWQSRTNYRNEPCWSCGQRGYFEDACGSCYRGQVDCTPCGASGKVRCDDCSGAGKRLYRHTRTALVDASVTLTIAGMEPDIWRAGLLARWNAILAHPDTDISQVARLDVGAEAKGLRVGFRVAVAAATAVASGRDAEAPMAAFGAGDPVVHGEPILARAFDLPDPDGEADWVDVASRLTGTRLLREAVVAFDERHQTLKKNAKLIDQAQDAARASLMRTYGAALGPPGAAAVAMAVSRGVGALREQARRRSWLLNFVGAVVIGTVGATIAVLRMLGEVALFNLGPEARGATPPSPNSVQLLAIALVVGLVWAIAGIFMARRRVRAVGRALGHDAAPPRIRKGWMRWAVPISALLMLLSTAATLYAAYSLSPSFRNALIELGPQRARAKPVAAVATSVTVSAARVRADPSTDAPVLATIQEGTPVTIVADDGEWVLVEVDGVRGYISARLLSGAGSAGR